MRIRTIWVLAAFPAALSFGCGSGSNTFTQVTSPVNPGSATETPAGPPNCPDGFVFRPTFDTMLGNVEAGTAFVVILDDAKRPILLSALHLLGAAGGLNLEVQGKDVKLAVRKLSLTPAFGDGPPKPVAASWLSIPDTAPLDKDSRAGDFIAARLASPDGFEPMKLGTTNPRPGSRVWVAAPVVKGAPSTQRLHGATVVGVQEGYLVYRFDIAGIELVGTSGGAVLTSAGEVVAVHVGGGKQGASLLGLGTPVERFRPALEAAAK